MVSRFGRFLALVCCASFLTGCAAIPLQPAASYWQNLYRRIPYKIEGNYRVLDVFYATDRKPAGENAAAVSYTNELGDGLAYGKLAVKVNPGVKIEKMLPKRLKRKGIIGIQDVQALDEDAFMKQLSEAVTASPHNSLLVVVFGYKDDFEATAIKAAYFSYLLDTNTPVLLFDWPGDQPVSISGYERAQANAKASGPYLGELLAKIMHKMAPQHLWIEASSMGAQVVCDAVDNMGKHADLADPDTEIDHILFAAPDVGKDEFRTHFKDKLAALSRKLTVYVASDDSALLVSGIINQEQRLGRSRIKEPKQLEEANEMLYLQSLDPARFTVIDVTPINYASYKHGYYLESPEFYDDFYMRILDAKPNMNRHLYLLKCADNTDYWVLRGDK